MNKNAAEIGPVKVDIRLVGDLLADPESSATVLHAMLLAFYKDELYGNDEAGIPAMDPVELWIRVREDFRVSVHENNENKINAIMLAMSTDLFYDDPEVFVAICLALFDGDIGDMVSGVMEDITVPEMLWGIYEVELNRDDYQAFAPSIVRIIDEAISQEAEDRDTDEADVLPYFERIINEKRQQMLGEMRLLGWPEEVIRKDTMTRPS